MCEEKKILFFFGFNEERKKKISSFFFGDSNLFLNKYPIFITGRNIKKYTPDHSFILARTTPGYSDPLGPVTRIRWASECQK
jgi:hypothetical protein